MSINDLIVTKEAPVKETPKKTPLELEMERKAEKGNGLILNNEDIKGAALDVFENEPHPKQELVDMDNVIMTPHVGSATHVARFNLSKEAANNVLSFFKDGKAVNQVN